MLPTVGLEMLRASLCEQRDARLFLFCRKDAADSCNRDARDRARDFG